MNDSLERYSQEEIEVFKAKILESYQALVEFDKLMVSEFTKPSPKESNVIYINRVPVAEFNALKDVEVSLPDLTNLVHRWSNELWGCAYMNIGYLKNKALSKSLVEMRVNLEKLIKAEIVRGSEEREISDDDDDDPPYA